MSNWRLAKMADWGHTGDQNGRLTLTAQQRLRIACPTICGPGWEYGSIPKYWSWTLDENMGESLNIEVEHFWWENGRIPKYWSWTDWKGWPDGGWLGGVCVWSCLCWLWTECRVTGCSWRGSVSPRCRAGTQSPGSGWPSQPPPGSPSRSLQPRGHISLWTGFRSRSCTEPG